MARTGRTARIGTAGWSIPLRYADRFPAEGSALERYSAILPAVEINSSFHRPHRRATYERWAASVPAHFSFAVKLPKTVSHGQALVEADYLLDTFLEEISGLGSKLAVVLVQLPPKLAFDALVAARFLAGLHARLPAGVEVVCEPRNESWLGAEADGLLREHRVARVAADPSRFPSAARPGGWPGLRYYRLHGAPRVYYSSYEDSYLEALAAELNADAPAWCIFDNTASGAAMGNALKLLW